MDIDYRDLMDSDKASPASINELIGAWKVIKLPKNLNTEATLETETSIYYYFKNDGSYYRFIAENNKNLTFREIENMASKIIDNQYSKFTLMNGILTDYFPEIRKSYLNIINKDYGIALKGDLFIAPQSGKYNPMNFELLRPLNN